MSVRPAAKAYRTRLRPPAHSSVYLEVATLRASAAIASLLNATIAQLTRLHGKGPWSGQVTARGVRFEMTRSVVYLARVRGRVIATLTLSRRRPWAIAPSYFTASRRPLYLTAMAVHPDHQDRGMGRRCMKEVRTLAEDWQADAVRLDAFDAAAGAGGFYSACGMR